MSFKTSPSTPAPFSSSPPSKEKGDQVRWALKLKICVPLHENYIWNFWERLINFGLEVEGFADREVIILPYDETKDKSLKDERFEGKKRKI